MRFVSCFVSGFGKLCNQAFDLSKDVVEIKAKNGGGKTTLAAFLESMLFGLESSRSRVLAENPRLKYEPWQGGAFGGSLTFIHAGKTYRIERKFGKTPSADSVKLYDKNNMPCYEFGENVSSLGELLLGVNRETYKRSAYIPQGAILSESLPDDAKARLIALLSVDGEKELGANSAIKRLDEAERKLRARRAPAKGKLDEIDEKIEALVRAKADCERAAEEARKERENLIALETTLAENEQGKGEQIKKKRSLLSLAFASISLGMGFISLPTLPALSPILWVVSGALLVYFFVGKKQSASQANGKDIERWIAQRTRLELQAEKLAEQAYAYGDYQAEIERLGQEKARLETRLRAIKTAKELLIRARSNMASCYLAPVEEKFKEYAKILSKSEEELCLTAEGTPIVDENGSFKQIAHYSAGTQDLMGLCMRLALAEAVFDKGNLPVLVLDDPLVNFDDETTARAKRLLRGFSKKYQIVYFTCKEERKL